MNSASVDVWFFWSLFKSLYTCTRDVVMQVHGAPEQRLADTTPWREKKGVLPFWNFYRCKTFAGFKFCWIQVLLDSILLDSILLDSVLLDSILLDSSFAGFTFAGFKFCWIQFCWIQVLLDSTFCWTGLLKGCILMTALTWTTLHVI